MIASLILCTMLGQTPTQIDVPFTVRMQISPEVQVSAPQAAAPAVADCCVFPGSFGTIFGGTTTFGTTTFGTTTFGAPTFGARFGGPRIYGGSLYGAPAGVFSVRQKIRIRERIGFGGLLIR